MAVFITIFKIDFLLKCDIISTEIKKYNDEHDSYFG